MGLIHRSLFVKTLLFAFVLLHLIVLPPDEPFLCLEHSEAAAELFEIDEIFSSSTTTRPSLREKRRHKRFSRSADTPVSSSASVEVNPFTPFNPVARIPFVVLRI